MGKYYSQEWVKKNVLRLSDEEIEEMQEQIDKEPQPVDPNAPVDQQGQQDDQGQQDEQGQQQEESPPIDNTIENNSTESDTPELDDKVKKFSKVINIK